MIAATIDQRRMTELLANANPRIFDPLKLELIQLTLAVSVPIAVANLLEIGGPQDYHLEDIRERIHRIQGDETGSWSGFADMMMGGKQAREEIILLCDMLAVLAFYPGGINLFGLHFEALALEGSEGAI